MYSSYYILRPEGPVLRNLSAEVKLDAEFCGGICLRPSSADFRPPWASSLKLELQGGKWIHSGWQCSETALITTPHDPIYGRVGDPVRVRCGFSSYPAPKGRDLIIIQ